MAGQRMRRVDEAVREVLADAIGRQLRMKRTPTLEFRLDHTTENAFKLDALIAEVAPGGEETPQA